MVRIVCGLGNPGSEYEQTRHNLGFDIIDRLAERMVITGSGEASWFDYRTVSSPAGDVFIVRPATYVNRSGLAVVEALGLFEADPSELIVITDDYHLPLGSLRIRKSGSSGGHNGLESIIDELGRNDFARVRAGIGPLPQWAVSDGEKIPDFVLGRFDADDGEIVAEMISFGAEAVEVALKESLDLAISRYNKVNPTPEQ